MSTLAVDSIALPLDNEQTNRLHEAVAGLSPAQLQWVSGYVAGLAAAGTPAAAVPATVAAADTGNTLTVLYGSQTGNGRAIAESLAGRARAKGFAVQVESLAVYRPAGLKRETLVAFVISTHGEGDPPDDAELFHEFVLSAKAPKLPNLRYAVLALGDSSYVNFCQTGRELDARLAELGAERLGDLVECDLDYDGPAAAWTSRLLDRLPEWLEAGAAVPRLRAVESTVAWDRQHPFMAEVLANQKITGRDSTKDVRHIELSLEGSGIRYEPGDSLAVVAHNPPELVRELVDVLGLDAEAVVTVREQGMSLGDALTKELEITAPSLGFLKQWAKLSDAGQLRALLEAGDPKALARFLATHQIVDVVRLYTASVTAADFAASLRRLSPRSYSIASSLAANPDEVHLTVAAVRYDAFGRPHWGAASTFLADRVGEGQQVAVFVEPNTRFRLPADDKPIVMIGPGTGVAPFRAFVEERAERGASGRSWLFFGDRNFSSDFLYQLEWHRHLKQGQLDRLTVAFSRDQDRKVYVQHRIREHAAELYRWLQDGACLYVCGDAKYMAGDVDAALADVIAGQAGIGGDEARARLKEMRREGRYQRDVY
jgi:sulfite reductase (NADPH) flavoprotein alpha-component